MVGKKSTKRKIKMKRINANEKAVIVVLLQDRVVFKYQCRPCLHWYVGEEKYIRRCEDEPWFIFMKHVYEYMSDFSLVPFAVIDDRSDLLYGKITIFDDRHHAVIEEYQARSYEEDSFIRTMAYEWVRFNQELPHAKFNDFMGVFYYNDRDYYDEWKRGELFE